MYPKNVLQLHTKTEHVTFIHNFFVALHGRWPFSKTLLQQSGFLAVDKRFTSSATRLSQLFVSMLHSVALSDKSSFASWGTRMDLIILMLLPDPPTAGARFS